MKTQELTPKQSKTLYYIESFRQKKFYYPSLAEISKHFRISITSAFERLDRLVQKRYVKKIKKYSPRNYKLI